jgi:hypothetical protein
MVAKVETAAVIDGLWRNARDSIKHALDHFNERTQERAPGLHNAKWIVLSVHHAAECFCNMRLLQLDPNAFPRGYTDYLHQSLPKLRNDPSLTKAELLLFDLLGKLPPLRNELMHRLVPEKMDLTISAMCMMGLLKYVERHTGTATKDIVWQDPPVKRDVIEAIHYSKIEEYSRFIEAFIAEKHKDRVLPECPSCGVAAVVGWHCEACFEELGWITCPATGEDTYYMDWQKGRIPQIECPHCGDSHPI